MMRPRALCLLLLCASRVPPSAASDAVPATAEQNRAAAEGSDAPMSLLDLDGKDFAEWAHVGRVDASEVAPPKNVLWLPLGDSITFGCTGPTIQDCHSDSGGYRVPLAYALSQAPLGSPAGVGFNVSTMGTQTTGPAYVPRQWLNHEGHPGWQINTVDGILNKSLATSPQRPDLITIHLGTNDCNAGVSTSAMTQRMDSLLGHILAQSPASHVFLADVIATGNSWNACIKSFNDVVPNITAEWVAKGMKIEFVPMYEPVGICGAGGSLTNLCGGHQIHPTSAGYPRMVSAFALSIMQNFKP